MTAFLVVMAVVLALVAGAWLRLAPSAEDRRVAVLRMAASRQGLKVRWMPRSEQESLGLGGPLAWYCLPAGGDLVAGEDAVAVVAGSGYRWLRGTARALPEGALPKGVEAVGLDASGVRVAWDERDEKALAGIEAWLRAWAGSLAVA